MTTMEPGIYRLTEDCPAHRPDKRMRDDWRAAPMKAGMLFAVRAWAGYDHHPMSALCAADMTDVAELHGYTHDRVRVSEIKFRDKLARIDNPTATQYLAFLHGRGMYPAAASAILDRLMADGLLTTKAIDRMLAEDAVEYAARENAKEMEP